MIPGLRENAALQALARTGALGAADALHILLGGRDVELTHTGTGMLPDLVFRLGGSASAATAIVFRVAGDLPGSVLLVLPGTSAQQLASVLLGREVGADLAPPAQSAVEEAANILASTYLTEVGRAARMELLPSVPHLIRGRLDSILDLPLEMIGADANHVASLEAGLLARPSGPAMTLGHLVPVDALPRLVAAL